MNILEQTRWQSVDLLYIYLYFRNQHENEMTITRFSYSSYVVRSCLVFNFKSIA